MSLLAPTLQAFFTQRLTEQLRASPNTIAAYRDTFRLLLGFAQQRTRKAPSKLELSDLDAPLIGAFLEHLESARGNSVRTRNARLAAIHSLFRFAALRHPDHAAHIQRVLAIPEKRCDRATVSFLDRDETTALLTAPDCATWIGRRDHALLVVALQTGLRVSELTRLHCEDVQLGAGAHLVCHGKRRKQRCTPLTAETVAVLRVWLQERPGQPADPLFPSRRGTTLSRDAVSRLLTKHITAAASRCPSLRHKKATPHVLRHTAAMELLQAGVDTTVIALWLGHEDTRTTTSVYLHADLAIKERALARVTPRHAVSGRYRPPDALLRFLEAL
jgi:site-specific recombinase XerD